MNIMKLNKNWKLKIVKKMKVCLKFRDQLFQWIVLFYQRPESSTSQQPWFDDDVDNFIGLFLLLHFCHANVCPQYGWPKCKTCGPPAGKNDYVYEVTRPPNLCAGF